MAITNPVATDVAGPIKMKRYDITVASTGTTADIEIGSINGMSKLMFFTVPDLDDTDTAEFKIRDAWVQDIYASGEKAESSTHTLVVERPLVATDDGEIIRNLTLRVECSGAQASDRLFSITIYYI